MWRLSFPILILSLIMAGVSAYPVPLEGGPSVAVLDFGANGIGRLAAETLAINLSSLAELNIIDRDQVRSAAKGTGYSGSLNMSLAEARNLGAALGSDFYILGDSQTLRRSPSTGPPYFESYASLFLVSSRTGRLAKWQRLNSRAASADDAEKLLLKELSGGVVRSDNLVAIRRTQEEERTKRELTIASGTPVIQAAPDDDSTAEAQGLRLPRPYRRMKPPYPEAAANAEAEATVDVLLDLDANGEVGRVEIARWAGFGMDEATVETVKQLHFFPAIRNGTPTPLRILLRFNFRKPPK